MSVNLILSTKITETGSEPVSIAQAKLHASIDYSDYDSLIGIYLSAARQVVEDNTGFSLLTKTVQHTANIFPGYAFKLAYSPVTQVNYIKSLNDQTNGYWYDGDAKNIGVSNDIVTVELAGTYEIEYVTGYTSVPANLKLAVLQVFTHIFNHRGEYEEGVVDMSAVAQRILANSTRFAI